MTAIRVHELDLPLKIKIKERELPVIGQFSFQLDSTESRIEKVILNISWFKNNFLEFIDDFRDFYAIDLDYSWFESINDQDKIRLIVSLKSKYLQYFDNCSNDNLENIILHLATLECWKLVDIEYELIPR